MGDKLNIYASHPFCPYTSFSERMKLFLRSCANKNENRYPKLARVTPKERTITMNKKDYNEKCKVSIQEHKIDFDMLIQSYANLDK